MSEYVYASHGEPLANERGEILLARAGEIVRCRDCKHYGYGKYATHCYRFVHRVTPDGFCSWGERNVSN